MKEHEILESLIPAIVQNLEHRNAYARKYAVLTVMSVYQTFPDLIPDAPDHIEQFLTNESNPVCKRNAFMMLYNCAQDKAIR
jgi:coatomer subunit beta